LVEHGNFIPRHAAVFIDGVADYLPVAHDDHALAIGGNVQFVRDHDDGDAGFVQLLEQAHEFNAGAGVEVAGRFVGEQHFRPADERAGDGDPLLLSARKLAGKVVAPLAESAGGWGLCRDPKTRERRTVFADTADSGYQALLALCAAGKESLAQGTRRFDMPDFRPRADWVREMKRYGILPVDLAPAAPIDCYATEQKYWQALWYSPAPAAQ